MGVSVSSRRRAKALRARYLGPGFIPAARGTNPCAEVVYDNPGRGVRAQARQSEEMQKLHKTAQAAAEDARGVVKLMERKRWSNG